MRLIPTYWSIQASLSLILLKSVYLLTITTMMHISHPQYRLAELTRKNLEPSSKLLAEVFLAQNKTWATFNPPLDQVEKFMLDKTAEMLDWQQQLRDSGLIKKDAFINFVYLDENDNIVGVWTNFELVQYLSKESHIFLPQFQTLQKYGKQLEKSIDFRDKVPGRAIYAMFGGLKKELMGGKLSVNFYLDINHYLHNLGFRVLYGRVSSTIALGLILRYAGEMIAKVKGIENGKKITLSFVKWAIRPFSDAQNEKNKKQKAKL